MIARRMTIISIAGALLALGASSVHAAPPTTDEATIAETTTTVAETTTTVAGPTTTEAPQTYQLTLSNTRPGVDDTVVAVFSGCTPGTTVRFWHQAAAEFLVEIDFDVELYDIVEVVCAADGTARNTVDAAPVAWLDPRWVVVGGRIEVQLGTSAPTVAFADFQVVQPTGGGNGNGNGNGNGGGNGNSNSGGSSSATTRPPTGALPATGAGRATTLAAAGAVFLATGIALLAVGRSRRPMTR